MMNIDNLASMFSQRYGVQQSMSSSIMSAIMGYIMQKGMGSMLSGGSGSGGGAEGIKSMLSNLGAGSGQGINQDHELVKTCTAECWYKRSSTSKSIYTSGPRFDE